MAAFSEIGQFHRPHPVNPALASTGFYWGWGAPLLGSLGTSRGVPERDGIDQKMVVQLENRLDRQQAAAFLTAHGYRTAPATLAKLASIGGGPLFESFGRKPLYRETDLIEWARSKTTGPRRSTSDL